jgi:outer membrane protein OmpA-like peptidoglycan-associated protein
VKFRTSIMAAVIGAAVAVGAVLADGTSATAQDAASGQARVRDLIYRWRALDNSERVEQSGEQTTITLSDEVLFEFDRADLKPQAQSRLDDVADTLADLGGRTVTITGHTDNKGDTSYNQDLSERRAQAVRDALANRLGSGFSFDVSGKGESEPVAPNENDDGSDNPDGRALNRRVEIRYPNE